MKMQFSEALGAQAPLGFWDPLGLLKDADQERFDRLRYVRKCHEFCWFQSSWILRIFELDRSVDDLS